MPSPIQHNGREILTIDQARKQVGVSRRTIYHWVRQGKVQWVRLAGGRLRIFADTLVQSPQKL